jgi:hypothetical protein
MNEFLKILESAISDVGVWRWWNADVPNVFQIEFSGVQLWIPPTAQDKPPSGLLSLAFIKPCSVVFLDFTGTMPEHWMEDFHHDKLKPFGIVHDQFQFNNPEFMHQLRHDTKSATVFWGNEANEVHDTEILLSFTAGAVGLIIIAEEMTIATLHGKVSAQELTEMSRKWWAYWKEYWKAKETQSPFPQDYACEVTIPIKGSLD